MSPPAPRNESKVASLGDARRRRQTPTRPEDSELVARALAGDRWAEEALYHRHVRAVTGVTIRLLGRTAEAEDVVQDTFVSALERLAQLRDPQMFRAWLLRIAVHHAHRRFRRRRLRRALGLQDGLDDASLRALAGPSETPETRAELRRLDRALGRLPAKHRVAWMLRHVEGMQLREVAEVCDTSLASIKRWLTAAEAVISDHISMSEAPDE